MGKGAGGCEDRPALLAVAGGTMVQGDSLTGLLKDKKLTKALGKDWIANAQWRAAMEILGEEPIEKIERVPDKDLQRELKLAMIKKGPASPEAKALRAQLTSAAGSDDNPAYREWHDRKDELLGELKTVQGQKVWQGGSLVAEEIGNALALETIGELQVLEEESKLQADASKREDLKKNQAYSKWLANALFSGEASNAGWHVLEDGQVVFLGYADQTTQVEHHGVAAKSLLKRTDYTIGYRYWSVDKEGRLRPPMASGAPWAPGINKAQFQGDWDKQSTAGLYAFKHEPKVICDKAYFDIHTGTHSGSRVMITACVMWDVEVAWGKAVRAQYAAPAVFLALPSDTAAFTKSIEKSAKLYHAKIAAPKDMKKAADEWIKDTLVDF